MKKTSNVYVMITRLNKDEDDDLDSFLFDEFSELMSKYNDFNFPYLKDAIQATKHFSFADEMANFKIDYKFAIKLNRFDVITFNCLSSDTDLGKELLLFLSNWTDCILIVFIKEFESTERLVINFKAAINGDQYDLK